MTTTVKDTKIENFEDYAASIIEKSRKEAGLSVSKLCRLVKIKPSKYEKMIKGDFDCVSHDEFFLILGMIDPEGELMQELIRCTRIIMRST